MKKNIIIPTTLIAAMTVLWGSLANTEIKENLKLDDNPTQLNIEAKNITNNLNSAFKKMMEFDDEETLFSTLEYKDVVMLFPDVQKLYLNDSNLSISDTSANDNIFKIGMLMDIDIECYWTNQEKEETWIYNKIDLPIYLYYSTQYETLVWWQWEREVLIDKISKYETNEEWVYDLSPVTTVLSQDLDVSGINNEFDAQKIFFDYQYLTMPFIVNQSITQKGISPETGLVVEYEGSSKIADSSKNEISIYAQRDYNSTDLKTSDDDLFKEEYLIATKTFKTEIVNKELPNLSGGAIAGIVIGSLAGVTLIGGGSYWLIKHKG